MVAHYINPDSKPCILTYEERQDAPLLYTNLSTKIRNVSGSKLALMPIKSTLVTKQVQ